MFVPFSGPWTTPPGISWAYGEICVLLTHLFIYLFILKTDKGPESATNDVQMK